MPDIQRNAFDKLKGEQEQADKRLGDWLTAEQSSATRVMGTSHADGRVSSNQIKSEITALADRVERLQEVPGLKKGGLRFLFIPGTRMGPAGVKQSEIKSLNYSFDAHAEKITSRGRASEDKNSK